MSWFKKLTIITVIIFLTITLKIVYDFNVPNNQSESVSVVVERGENLRSISKKLEQAEVISSRLLFRIFARVYNIDKGLKAGEYLFEPYVSMKNVLNTISNGKVFYRKITIPEGLTTYQILDLLRAEDNLSGEITIFPAEGELLPETYSFSKGDKRDFIIEQARKAMAKVLNDVWIGSPPTVLRNKYELLILASIIEKETSIPEERQDIAAVFVNRLQIRMKLQTDPTVIYAITQGKQNMGRKLYKKDLAIDSPFNTYKYYGLPPAPICNPGKESIWAAANPSSADYLYFVATGKGGHYFSKTLKEHNENVSIYRKFLKSLGN